MLEVTTPSKVCFPLIYIFFEVTLTLRIDGIRSCLEDYILLFLFDVCMYIHIYVYMYIYALYVYVLIIYNIYILIKYIYIYIYIYISINYLLQLINLFILHVSFDNQGCKMIL